MICNNQICLYKIYPLLNKLRCQFKYSLFFFSQTYSLKILLLKEPVSVFETKRFDNITRNTVF